MRWYELCVPHSSDGADLSRSVTSCAGMTAYLVLLAQTRVGFLSGGRGKSLQLSKQERGAQKEEAFMGPLDMRGLIGAAGLLEIWGLLQWT